MHTGYTQFVLVILLTTSSAFAAAAPKAGATPPQTKAKVLIAAVAAKKGGLPPRPTTAPTGGRARSLSANDNATTSSTLKASTKTSPHQSPKLKGKTGDAPSKMALAEGAKPKTRKLGAVATADEQKNATFSAANSFASKEQVMVDNKIAEVMEMGYMVRCDNENVDTFATSFSSDATLETFYTTQQKISSSIMTMLGFKVAQPLPGHFICDSKSGILKKITTVQGMCILINTGTARKYVAANLVGRLP